jgi:hypothetical protein
MGMIDKIKYWYWDVIPYDYRPSELWSKVKCFLWKRYKIVNPRYLPYTWCDRRELLAHAMFEILSNFVEKECSPGCVDWYHEYAHKINIDGKEVFVRDEMQHLYDWWHKAYLKEYAEIEEHLWDLYTKFTPPIEKCFEKDGKYYRLDMTNGLSEEDRKKHEMVVDSIKKFEIFIEEELQEKLHRIVNVRLSMWT